MLTYSFYYDLINITEIFTHFPTEDGKITNAMKEKCHKESNECPGKEKQREMLDKAREWDKKKENGRKQV